MRIPGKCCTQHARVAHTVSSLLSISLLALPSGLLNLIKASGNLHDEKRKPGGGKELADSQAYY